MILPGRSCAPFLAGAPRVDSQDRSKSLANATLALMSEWGVPPTPQNYQLFYVYAANENPALSQVLGERMEGTEDISSVQLEELHEKFFGSRTLEEAVDDIGTEFAGKVGEVLGKLAEAEKGTQAYGRVLNAASGQLHGEKSSAGLERLVSMLIGATRAMESRAKGLENELQRSSREVQDLQAKLDDVRKESLTDPLTGIANRKALDFELARAVELARTRNEPLSFFMCDIDRFKSFNDTWGHQTGDQVLRLVGHCLSENVKGRDTAARYGGEEFAVILPQTTLPAAILLANRIRANVENKKLVKRSTGDILGTLTVSIGVAQLDAGEAPEDLVRRADECLYAAKNAGRNCVIGGPGTQAPSRTVAA
jgi:diguanylate cyclase